MNINGEKFNNFMAKPYAGLCLGVFICLIPSTLYKGFGVTVSTSVELLSEGIGGILLVYAVIMILVRKYKSFSSSGSFQQSNCRPVSLYRVFDRQLRAFYLQFLLC
ncbi:hypothetical protein [Paenibacillus sp. GCM10012306]|uniref:hypothetical protein n=1 Tax=Paenibacillus sp. GCM10012306 TaxID=3317342 RepID=UPI0036230999